MNYNKLKYFYEIAKIQNLSRASELLYVSQSSLSKAIADLEKDFGTPLFIRTNRNLVLTNAGIALQQQLENVFSKEQELYALVREASTPAENNLSGHINVGFMSFKESLELPEFIKSFQKDYPLITFSNLRYNKKEIWKKLEDQTLDVALVMCTIEELSPQFNYKILDQHHLSIVARKDHPLANRFSIDITELKNDSFLTHGHRKNSLEYLFAIGWAERSGFQPNIIAEYDYVEIVLLMIQAGSGVSILSDAAPIEHYKDLVNIPLNNAPVFYSAIFWNKNNPSKPLSLFLEKYFNRNTNS